MIVTGKGWTMHHGDCIEVMASMAEKSVDHVITDPPYDSGTHDKARSLKDGGSDIAIDFDVLDVSAAAPALMRITRRWCIAFCSLEMLGNYRAAWGANGVRSGVWDRPDGTPQISGDRPGQAAEGIAIGPGPEKKRWNRGGKRGMWRCGVERVERYGHPTPKPIGLMLELVSDFTDPDEIILDPFAGSGTTGVAALRLGRRFIGIEKDEKYFRLACDRLRAEEQGSTLQAARAGQEALFKP